MRNWHTRALLLAAVSILAVAIRVPALSDFTPGDDEKDYRRAVREGFWSIYVGNNTVSFPAIIKRYFGDPRFRERPWATLMSEGDQLAIRHFHVPLAFYPSAVFGARPVSNQAHRVFPLLASAACAPLVLAGLWSLGVAPAAALVGATLVAVDRRFIIASRILTPHPLFLLLACGFLFALAQLLRDPGPRRRFLAIGLFGATVSCLELAPLLALAAVVSTRLFGAHLGDVFWTKGRWPQSLAWLFIVLLVAWPAGLLRLGYVTAYGVFAALAVVHRDEYYGGAGALTLYHRLFENNYLLSICAGVAVFGAVLTWRFYKGNALLSVVACYAIVTMAFNWLNRYRNATYAAEATVFIWILFAVVIQLVSMRGRSGRVAAMGLMTVGWAAALFEIWTMI